MPPGSSKRTTDRWRRVTCSGRHVIGVVAALASQVEVDRIIYGRVVGRVGGAIHENSKLAIVSGSIADHRATLADLYPEIVPTGEVAGYNPSGDNPGPEPEKVMLTDHSIAPHDPSGGNPNRARAAAGNAQSFNDRAIAAKLYPDRET